MDTIKTQDPLFDAYTAPAQPENCMDCEAWLDGRDLRVAWDYCEDCMNSICADCNALHVCSPMLKSKPNPT